MNEMDNSRHIKIFDTTLRDGQQCPGAGMSFENNIRYVELCMGIGFDVMEVGFPAASKLDFEIVNTITKQFSSNKSAPMFAGLCQLREEQVDITIDALKPAVPYQKARLHVYVPVAPDLMVLSLGELANQKPQIVKLLNDYVKKAVAAGMEVEFSPEGYSRMAENFDFVTDLIRAAVSGGATVINCPDTIGGACHLQGKEYFVEKLKRHAEIIDSEFSGNSVTWSTHCHNDFGLAVENSINAVFFGPARQIEGCVNGVGERAGNAAIEQCILIIKEFAKYQDSANPFYTNINTEKLQEVSDFISKNMLKRQPHWPINGDNAAKHSAGGHTNAILKNPQAYQPFDPGMVGQEVTFSFGPLSGGNHAKAIIEKFGYRCDEAEKAQIAQYLKDLYKERRKGITDEELLAGYCKYRQPIDVVEFDYSRSSNQSAVHLTGRFFGQEGHIHETHDGKDSALAALTAAVNRNFSGTSIQGHKSESDSEGIHARSISTIVLKDARGEIYKGIGEDQDIEISAMKAYIDAVNKAYVDSHYRK